MVHQTFRQTIKLYYRLTKPGIVYGNAIAAIGGYFFGANGNPELSTFTSMLIGISAVIASACVFNNVIDSDIDSKMDRTRNRAVVTGSIKPLSAILFGAALLLIGSGLLYAGTNLIALAVALFGHFAYVVLYTYSKRKTVHGTLIGTISGSTPPVIGYVAATGQIDVTAGILFIIMLAWQMPHFYAIAIFRREDYRSAGIPVLSIVKGYKETRRQIFFYVILFVISCILLGLYGGSSILWTLVMVLIGLYWLYLCLQFTVDHDIVRWARKQFGWSLTVLLVFSLMLSLDSFLH